MDSLTNREFESIYRRIDRDVSLRGATTPQELLRRLRRLQRAQPRYAQVIETLIEHDMVTRLLRHYYEGKRMRLLAPRMSRRIYRRMKPRRVEE